MNIVCERAGFLWRCWSSKAWINTLVHGTLKRHQAGLVCPQVLLEPPPAGGERLFWEQAALTPPSLTSLRMQTLRQCRRVLCRFKIWPRLGKLWVGSGAWAEKGARLTRLICCSTRGRVLPHVLLTATSEEVSQRRLFFSEACTQCTYVLLCCFARNASTVWLKPRWIWKIVWG